MFFASVRKGLSFHGYYAQGLWPSGIRHLKCMHRQWLHKVDKLRKKIPDDCPDVTYEIYNGRIIPSKQKSIKVTTNLIPGKNEM